MTRDIFISYSRRDQEFVTRLASDLNEQVAGVWFDQSTIQLGQKWHDAIMEGIRACKAFILVLSPDAMESEYVREEVNKALELGKTIFPVIYRPASWTAEFEALVRDIQTLDLRSGSYTDNFQKLVDGLIEAGAGIATGERPFLRQPTKTGLDMVLRKVPGWGFAWSMGWLVFWIVVLALLATLAASEEEADSELLVGFGLLLISGVLGGFLGGLVAGLFTMLALRPNAPSIRWKHMSPTIRIWAISGPLGILVSGLITALMLITGAIAFEPPDRGCAGLSFGQCLGQAFGDALGAVLGMVLLAFFVFLLFILVMWFLTGMFAGWLSVRHIRRLEPGITKRQGWKVSAGWGCGAIVAAIMMILLMGMFSSALGP